MRRTLSLSIAVGLGLYVGLARYAKGWKRPHWKARRREIMRALDGCEWPEAHGCCADNDEQTHFGERAA